MITKLNLNSLTKTSFTLLMFLILISSGLNAQSLVSTDKAIEILNQEVLELQIQIDEMDQNSPDMELAERKKKAVDAAMKAADNPVNLSYYTTEHLIALALWEEDPQNLLKLHDTLTYGSPSLNEVDLGEYNELKDYFVSIFTR